MDPIQRVGDALEAGQLRAGDLTARRLGAFLGKTTSVLYHHWGSLDGFLYAVSQTGFRRLAQRQAAVLADGDLTDLAEVFVAFGLDHPALYALMFERPYDWDALRASGAFEADSPGARMWTAVVDGLRAAGAQEPDVDARLLMAGLHGLVSLAASGRANVGALSVPDRAMALTLARQLARRVCPSVCRRDNHTNEE